MSDHGKKDEGHGDGEHKADIIIVKRITKKHGHHGGGWKIAYADFMTAMMAFFMLLWLLSMLNKFQLQGISNYFKTPMKDVFVENQMHNTNIPKVAAEHIQKSELAPKKGKTDGHSLKKNTLIKTNKSDEDVAKTNTEGPDIDIAKKQGPDGSVKVIAKNKISNPSDINKAPPPPTPTATAKVSSGAATAGAAAGSSAGAANATSKAEAAQKNKDNASGLEALKAKLESDLKKNPELKQYAEHLDFKIVADGLRIDMKSLKNKPMFSTGQTDFKKYASKVLTWLSGELNKTQRKISIIGHTDTDPYSSPEGYTNWELSADRATAARRALIQSGMRPNQILRVQGTGSTDLLDKKNGRNPANRRVEIIVLTPEAVDRMTNQ